LRRFVFNSGFVNDGKLKIKIELIWGNYAYNFVRWISKWSWKFRI
jgi:hypothetical protein